jgi:hypothetical protein
MTRIVNLVATGTAVAALTIVLASCVSNEAGLNIPTENLVDSPASAAQSIDGEMRTAANGCFHITVDDVSYFVVWPEDFRQDGATVIGADGSRYSGGDALSGSGWVRSVDEVVAAADGADGYMGSVTGFCAEDGEQVVVFETLDSAGTD